LKKGDLKQDGVIQVAVDARRLQDRPLTGVGRYIAQQLPFLAEEFEIFLLTDARRPSPGLEGFQEVELNLPRKLPEPFWLHIEASSFLRNFEGIFHGTYNAVPYFCAAPSVVSMYDLSWEHHSEDMSWGKRTSFRLGARRSAKTATSVVTCSEFVRQSIMETYSLPPERVVKILPAVDPLFAPERAEDAPVLLERLGVKGDYIVAMGGAKRRGLEVAVGAWRELPAVDRPTLVVIGSDAPIPEEGIVHAGRLPDEEWATLLAGSMALCYPTRYEGYGMPAAEALVSGVPVVCAPVGSLPEVVGDAAELVDAPDVEHVAAGLLRVVTDSARRVELRAAGLAQAASWPTWEDGAKLLAQVYREVDT
jgi:glycosyltransferase involved in cell wall biosynthesis